MRILIIFLMMLPLCGCVDDQMDDLSDFIVKTKSKIYPINDKVPALKKIDAMAFSQEQERSPFSEPKAEVVAPVKSAPKSCPQPDFSRKKQPLEMYSLDNLIMRGTMLIDEELWAFVQVSQGELHKVKSGYYLGLNYGKVLSVTKEKIELLELAADRDGCWKERMTQITLQFK